jgi:hypothetical protein
MITPIAAATADTRSKDNAVSAPLPKEPRRGKSVRLLTDREAYARCRTTASGTQ